MPQSSACLCSQHCHDNLVTGLSWTRHCLFFHHAMSQPQYTVPWGFLSIRVFFPCNLLFTFL